MKKQSQSHLMEPGQVWPAEYYGPGDTVRIASEWGGDLTYLVTFERQLPGQRQWLGVTQTGRTVGISWDEPCELVSRRQSYAVSN